MSTTHEAPLSPLPAGGWFWIDNDLLDRCGPQLGVYGLAVYMALARCADRQRECRPSYQTIARAIGCSRRQVIREIHRLEKLGLVAKMGRATAWGNASANGYRLLVLSGAAAAGPHRVMTETVQTGDAPSPLGTVSHRPGDSQSLGVVTGTTGGGDWLSPKQDIKNKTQREQDTDNKQPPQPLAGDPPSGDAGEAGGLVLFSSSGEVEALPPAGPEVTASGAEEETEPAEEAAALSAPPAAAYSLTRFVQVTGRQPNGQERSQLLDLDLRYTALECCYLFDALDNGLQRGDVRHPLAYVQAIARRQERHRWPGRAVVTRTQPADDPERYALPPALTTPRPPTPREETPLLFRQVIDELGRELQGRGGDLDLRRLTFLACDGDSVRIGAPEARLAAWLQERAAPVVRRVAQRISQKQGHAVQVEFAYQRG